jgi:lipid-binding SYLF domain-containing protein
MIKKIAVSLISLVTLAGGAFAADTVAERLQQSTAVLQAMTHMDDKGIPMDTLQKAVCVIVIPNLKKGGFIVGAKYGKGFISCRRANGVGWTAPGAMRIEGGSFGFLIGGTENDLILLVMNKEGAQKLLADKFTIGTDATAAAGPVGRTTAAATDAQLTAGILTYSRARGAFAGVAFESGTLRQDLDDNATLYGSKVGNKELMAGAEKVPAAADGFIAALDAISNTRAK